MTPRTAMTAASEGFTVSRIGQVAMLVARLPHGELWMAFLRDPDAHLLAIMREAPRG